MAPRIHFPSEALKDVAAILRLSNENLDSLASFVDENLDASSDFDSLAEKIHVSPTTARTIASVAMFLRAVSARGGTAEDIIDSIRTLVVEYAKDEEKTNLLENLDRVQPQIREIATPTPKWIRLKKIHRLANGPQPTFEFCRTVCQLRPLFEQEGEDEGDDPHDEDIMGLVGNVLVELHLSDPNDEDEVIVFNLGLEELDDLIEVFERTRRKLSAIRRRYGEDLLNFNGRDDNE